MKLVDVIPESTIRETQTLVGIAELCQMKAAVAEFGREEDGSIRLHRAILVAHKVNLAAPDTLSMLLDGLK